MNLLDLAGSWFLRCVNHPIGSSPVLPAVCVALLPAGKSPSSRGKSLHVEQDSDGNCADGAQIPLNYMQDPVR